MAALPWPVANMLVQPRTSRKRLVTTLFASSNRLSTGALRGYVSLETR